MLAASTSAGEQAVFAEEGTVSFSFYFWGRIFSGDSFYEAFRHARESVPLSYRKQDAQLDGDGNGLRNEITDQDIARDVRIGNELDMALDLPRSVCPRQKIRQKIHPPLLSERSE